MGGSERAQKKGRWTARAVAVGAVVVSTAVLAAISHRMHGGGQPEAHSARPGGVRPLAAAGGPLVGDIVSLAMVEARSRERSAVLVDARAPERFRAGHVPGAVNLPAGDIPLVVSDDVRATMKLLPVIVYCESATCGDAEAVARHLRELNVPRVYVFEGGWEVWEEGGLPVETGP